MFIFEDLHTHSEINNKMNEFFQSMSTSFPDDETARNFLQRLAFMHVCVATGIEIPAKCKSNMGISDFFWDPVTVQDLEGLPADWACTIFSLFFHVHHYLKRNDQFTSAALLSNYILKNYAYKLGGTKRIAFMSNFFASLHHDYENAVSGSTVIKNIGRYILVKFDHKFYTSTLENRIYVMFVRLILADLGKQFDLKYWCPVKTEKEPEDLFKVMTEEADLHRQISDKSLKHFWSFLRVYLDMISNNETLGDHIRSFDVLVHDTACHTRWRKAIVASRFHNRYGKKVPKMVALWKKRLLFPEVSYRHEKKYAGNKKY